MVTTTFSTHKIKTVIHHPSAKAGRSSNHGSTSSSPRFAKSSLCANFTKKSGFLSQNNPLAHVFPTQRAIKTRVISTRYGYDNLERLAQIKYIRNEGAQGKQLIEQIDYAYDAAGRRTSKTTLNNNGAGGSGNAQETPFTATYDAANRMTAISLSIAGTTTATAI
jgi:hypothetical protein